MSKLLTALQGVEAPKVSLREIKGSTYQAASIQEVRSEQTNYSGSFNEIGRGIAQAGNMYIDERKRVAEERKNEILLKKLPPNELGKLRQEGILLYQDDKYAMRALDQALGRQEAYNIDATVQQRVQNGDYNTREDMERDRATLMENSRRQMALAYGMPEEGTEFFTKGYADNMTERNMSLYTAFSKKMDDTMRTESRTVVRNEVEAVAVSPQTSGSDIVTVVNGHRAKGLIRNDVEYLDHLNKALASASSTKGGDAKVQAMLDSEITLSNGTTTTLRAQLGEDAAKSMELKASEAKYKYDLADEDGFQDKLETAKRTDLTQPDGPTTALNRLDAMEAERVKVEGSDNNTRRAQEIRRAREELTVQIQKTNEKVAKEQKKKTQSDLRMREIHKRVQDGESGQAVPFDIKSYTETPETGAYEAEDYQRYYDWRMDKIMNDPNLSGSQKQSESMKLGKLLKSQDEAGFGARYKAQVESINNELANAARQIEDGQPLPDMPYLNNAMAMYKSDPAGFLSTYGEDADFALTIQAMADNSISPDLLIKGKANLARMTKEQRTLSDQQFTTTFQKQATFTRLPQSSQLQYRNWYASMEGLTDSQRIKAITNHVEANYTEFKTGGRILGAIPKNFLQLDTTNPKGEEEGMETLQHFVKESKLNEDSISGMTVVRNGKAIQIQTTYGTVHIINRADLVDYNIQRKVPTK